MVMDGTIFKLADDHCFSVTSYDSDLDWLRKVAADRGLDVTIEDITAATPHLQVQGPKSREILAPITEGTDLEQLRYFRFVPEGVNVGGVPCMRVAHRLLGRAGLRALLQRPTTRRALERGARGGQAARHAADRPVGDRDAADRVRAAVPGHRLLPAQTDPFEVRLDNVVKLDKPGDFVGKEALRADRRRGHAAAADHAAHRGRRACPSTAPP